MQERMKPYLPSLFLFLLVSYLGIQALTGERGLLSGASRDQRLAQRQIQLQNLLEERRDLEVRVRYLRTNSLSRDLLEERARAVIGFADPRDYLVSIRHAEPGRPVRAKAS